MTSVLLFSPHSDDVVLSCFGALVPGCEVITVFAGVPEDPAFTGHWDRRLGVAGGSRQLALRRLREDAASYRGTGALQESWDHLDDQYRQGPPDTEALRLAMKERISRAREIWLPAGIGDHPDHVLVRDAGLDAAGAPAAPGECAPRVRLYAEYPYRLQEMSGVPHGTTGPADGYLRAAGGDCSALARWFRRRFAGAAAVDEPERGVLPGAGRAAKERAVRCHASQVPMLDAQVAGTLLTPGALGTEYWWPLSGSPR